MRTLDTVFRDRYGLHPRAALRITQAAATFASTLTIESLDGGSGPVAARQMIALVSAGIRAGERIRVTADGPDEDAALSALGALFDAGVCHR